MNPRVGAVIVAMMLFAGPAFAAPPDGRWSGTMSTPMGDVPIAFVFKVDGAKLTGTMSGPDGTPLPIANGKIDGDKIGYTVTVDFGGMSLELVYKGVVNGNEIQLEMSVFDMPFPLVVHKDDKPQ